MPQKRATYLYDHTRTQLHTRRAFCRLKVATSQADRIACPLGSAANGRHGTDDIAWLALLVHEIYSARPKLKPKEGWCFPGDANGG